MGVVLAFTPKPKPEQYDAGLSNLNQRAIAVTNVALIPHDRAIQEAMRPLTQDQIAIIRHLGGPVVDTSPCDMAPESL
jgi:hypothetical protein